MLLPHKHLQADTAPGKDSRSCSPAHLKGCQHAHPEWLVDLLPNAPFPARLYGKDHFRQAKSTWTTYADTLELTPSTYAQMLADRSAHDQNVYMAQVPVRDTALADIIRPYVDVMGGHTGLKAAIDLNLWWGPGGHTEPLHFDSGDGTLVQLHGKKRAVLFPPSQSKNLYPFPIRRKGIAPWISQVYIENPDFKRFPTFGHRIARTNGSNTGTRRGALHPGKLVARKQFAFRRL